MGNNQNKKEEKPGDFLPIPDEYERKLNNPACNFSLYSPRMVKWKKDGQDLKSNTDTMEKQKDFFNKKNFSDFLVKKQKLQSDYIDELKSLGLQTFTIKAKTSSPFITGLGAGHPTETGIILDRNIGVPYIPASSIKGVLRLAHAINIANGQKEVPDSELVRYFGTADTKQKEQYRGQLVFLDAYPVGNVQLKVDIMNPHYKDYYSGKNKQPVETENPGPIRFLTVKEGTEFVFNCVFMPINPTDKCDEKEITSMFETAFEKVGFGGKTSIGYGRFARNDKEVNSSIQKSSSNQIKKEERGLEAGEYSAVISLKDKSHQSIYFEIGKHKIEAVKKNVKPKDFDKYKKQMNVKVKINGTKDKEGYYLVTEILSN